MIIVLHHQSAPGTGPHAGRPGVLAGNLRGSLSRHGRGLVNIVWIEDFDGLAHTEASLSEFFGNLFPPMFFRGAGFHLINSPKRVAEWCRGRGAPHVIEVYSKLTQVNSWFESDRLLFDTDVVLIDLNLEKAVDCDPPSDMNNVKTGGAYYYNRLVEKFPAERVAFLTANDLETNELTAERRKVNLAAPKCFQKHDDRSNLAKWLEVHANSSYFDCRRRIIDGCSTLASQSEEFRCSPIGSENVARVLSGVTTLLRIDNNELDHALEAALHRFLKPWGAVTMEAGDWKSKSMTYCRNWDSHGKLVTGEYRLTPPELAFVALLAFRAMTTLPPELMPHEGLLSTVACKAKSRPRTVDDVRAGLFSFLEKNIGNGLDKSRAGITLTNPPPGLKTKFATSTSRIFDLANIALQIKVGKNERLDPICLLAMGAFECLPKSIQKRGFELSDRGGKPRDFDELFAVTALSYF